MEVERIRKEQKEKLKDYEAKLQSKNKIINDLLTDQENSKTDKSQLSSQLSVKEKVEAKLLADVQALQAKLSAAESKNQSHVANSEKDAQNSAKLLRQLEEQNEALKKQVSALSNQPKPAAVNLIKLEVVNLYSLDRFEANYATDISSFLMAKKPVTTAAQTSAPSGPSSSMKQ